MTNDKEFNDEDYKRAKSNSKTELIRQLKKYDQYRGLSNNQGSDGKLNKLELKNYFLDNKYKMPNKYFESLVKYIFSYVDSNDSILIEDYPDISLIFFRKFIQDSHLKPEEMNKMMIEFDPTEKLSSEVENILSITDDFYSSVIPQKLLMREAFIMHNYLHKHDKYVGPEVGPDILAADGTINEFEYLNFVNDYFDNIKDEEYITGLKLILEDQEEFKEKRMVSISTIMEMLLGFNLEWMTKNPKWVSKLQINSKMKGEADMHQHLVTFDVKKLEDLTKAKLNNVNKKEEKDKEINIDEIEEQSEGSLKEDL